MMVRVLLFASLREITGKSEFSVPDPGPGGEPLSAGHLFEQLAVGTPALERYRKRVGIAVNERLASWDTPLSDGDEVAFYPPVSGGRR